VFDAKGLPGTSPRPTNAEEWEFDYTDSERKAIARQAESRIGMPVSFNHTLHPFQRSNGAIIGEVVASWEQEGSIWDRIAIHNTERGNRFAKQVRNGDIAHVSWSHYCRDAYPDEEDLTEGLAPGRAKECYETAIVPIGVGPGREGADIDQSSIVVGTERFDVEGNMWPAYCASAGMEGHENDQGVSSVVRTTVAAEDAEMTVVFATSDANESAVEEEEAGSSAPPPPSGDVSPSETKEDKHPISGKGVLSHEDAEVQDGDDSSSTLPGTDPDTSTMDDNTPSTLPAENPSQPQTPPATPPPQEGASSEQSPSQEGQTQEEQPPAPESSPVPSSMADRVVQFLAALPETEQKRLSEKPTELMALMFAEADKRANEAAAEAASLKEEKTQRQAEQERQAATKVLEDGFQGVKDAAEAAIASFENGPGRNTLVGEVEGTIRYLARVLGSDESMEKKQAAIAEAQEDVAKCAARKGEAAAGPLEWLKNLSSITTETPAAPVSSLKLLRPGNTVAISANSKMTRTTPPSANVRVSMYDLPLPGPGSILLVGEEAEELFGTASSYMARSDAVMASLGSRVAVQANSQMTRVAASMGFQKPGTQFAAPSPGDNHIHVPKVDPHTGECSVRTMMHPRLMDGTNQMLALSIHFKEQTGSHESKMMAIINNGDDALPGAGNYVFPQVGFEFVADAHARANGQGVSAP
jgi:molecular chaperone GrpE (heat shock protein)